MAAERESESNEERSNEWRLEARRLLYGTAVGVEDAVSRAKVRLRARLGTDQVRTVVTYRTYASTTRAHVAGRVLANELPGGPQDDDGWWQNLLATYRRWRTRELPDVPVEVEIAGQVLETRTDGNGVFVVDAELERSLSADAGWHKAIVRAPADPFDPEIVTHADIRVPSDSARFGVISDMDDTVIQSHVSNLLTQAKLTFLGNAKGRKPLEGVAGLYRAFERGLASDESSPDADSADTRDTRGVASEGNPIFYVSSSAWNLYDLFADFLELNEIPAGPLFLQQIGLSNNKWIGPVAASRTNAGNREEDPSHGLDGTGQAPGADQPHGHKLERAREIMDAYPELSFVLIGDSGQRDPELYVRLARERPEQVHAIYIHSVESTGRAVRAAAIEELSVETDSLGVPLLLVDDAVEIAHHAVATGLILPSALDAVTRSRDRDVARPELS